jgi:hypothetical protein
LTFVYPILARVTGRRPLKRLTPPHLGHPLGVHDGQESRVGAEGECSDALGAVGHGPPEVSRLRSVGHVPQPDDPVVAYCREQSGVRAEGEGRGLAVAGPEPCVASGRSRIGDIPQMHISFGVGESEQVPRLAKFEPSTLQGRTGRHYRHHTIGIGTGEMRNRQVDLAAFTTRTASRRSEPPTARMTGFRRPFGAAAQRQSTRITGARTELSSSSACTVRGPCSRTDAHSRSSSRSGRLPTRLPSPGS